MRGVGSYPPWCLQVPACSLSSWHSFPSLSPAWFNIFYRLVNPGLQVADSEISWNEPSSLTYDHPYPWAWKIISASFWGFLNSLYVFPFLLEPSCKYMLHFMCTHVCVLKNFFFNFNHVGCVLWNVLSMSYESILMSKELKNLLECLLVGMMLSLTLCSSYNIFEGLCF